MNFSDMVYNDYLKHHGILGMKWGVRRTPEQLGHRQSRREQYPRSRQRIEAMSDKDLQDKINRLNKERQYRDLTESTAVKVGKNFARAVLLATVTELAKEAFKGNLKNGMAWVHNMAHPLSALEIARIKG